MKITQSDVRIVTWVLCALSIGLNIVSGFINKRARRVLKDVERLNEHVAANGPRMIRDAWRGGLEEAANIVGTLAERPYDNEPACVALLHAEAIIHGTIRAMKDEQVQ